jgi:hypothetical protein
MADFLTDDGYQSMQLTPVSVRVNNPMHNDSDCLLEFIGKN